MVLDGQHIAYVVRQIYEALAEHFTEEDIQYQYRYMSCEILKPGTGVTVCAMLFGLHQQIQRVHRETTFSDILVKFVAVARLKRKRNDGHIDPLTGDEIHLIMQNVGLVQEDADNEASTKVTVHHVGEVWNEMPLAAVLPSQTLHELVFSCRQTIQSDIGGVWQRSVQQSRVTGSITFSSNVRTNWITKDHYQQAVSGSTGTLTLPPAFDLWNGWQNQSSMEWLLHIKSMHTCGNSSCDIESQYTCYTRITTWCILHRVCYAIVVFCSLTLATSALSFHFRKVHSSAETVFEKRLKVGLLEYFS